MSAGTARRQTTPMASRKPEREERVAEDDDALGVEDAAVHPALEADERRCATR